MLTPIAATLVSLALAQSAGSREPPAQQQAGASRTDASEPGTAPGTGVLDEPVPRGIPYMPEVGPPVRSTDGVFLDLALLSEVRAWTLNVTDAATTWAYDLEVTPGIALEIQSPRLTLSLGYAPRLSIPFDVGAFELAVLNRVTLNATWTADPLWAVTALGVFVVGDYSQLIPASTPGGAGPPPPTLNPVRSFETYPYVSIDALLRLDGTLSPRSRIRLAGGYFDVGGTGAVGQANQPRTWGPKAEAAFAWDASRNATLTTTAAVQDWMMVGDYSIVLAYVTESWRQSWTSELATTLSAGPAISNRDVESWSAAHHLAPVASFQFDYRQEARQPLHVAFNAMVGPYADAYLQIPYQRVTLGASIDWRPSDAWQLGASLSAALAPYSSRAPESYGTAGLSASFAPVHYLILSVGGFSQAQFQGASTGGALFRQWTTYFSLVVPYRTAL